MKKIIIIFTGVLLLFVLVACGDSNTDVEPMASEESTDQASLQKGYDTNDPVAKLEEITCDFSNVIANLIQAQEEMFALVGSTYKDYQENKECVEEWVQMVLSETDALFARTKDNSIAYFKLIANEPDHKYSEFCDEALEEYYDTVYDDAMEDYYDYLYDDAMENLYDQYYDGIIDDAYEDISYGEWSDALSEAYKTWSDASSAIYKKWSDETSYLYGLWSAMNSGFCWNDNYDVDAIVEEFEREKLEREAGQEIIEEMADYVESIASDQKEYMENIIEQEETTTSENETMSGLNPDFKAAMDSYEKFIEEYIAFMEKYKTNPSDLSLLTYYADYMNDYADFVVEFAEWENVEMSAAEAAYYIDVQARVSQKLLEVAL